MASDCRTRPFRTNVTADTETVNRGIGYGKNDVSAEPSCDRSKLKVKAPKTIYSSDVLVAKLAATAIPRPFGGEITKLPIAPMNLSEFSIKLTANVTGRVRHRRIRRPSAQIVSVVPCLD